MRIISFAWTTPAVRAKVKTCTRREWDDAYAARFNAGNLLAGYDRNPRFHGQQITVVRLTCKPYKEPYCRVPATDWQAEGFAHLEQLGATVHGMTPGQFWQQWLDSPLEKTCFVVRFEYV